MCMMVYIAADMPLDLVAWDDLAPAFNVSALAPDEERVRRQFGKTHVVYVGSYEGCACGFQLGEYPPDGADSQEREHQRTSLREFADYLRREIHRVGPIELFACWDGDQEATPEHRRVLTPSALEQESFFFLEKELSAVTSEAG